MRIRRPCPRIPPLPTARSDNSIPLTSASAPPHPESEILGGGWSDGLIFTFSILSRPLRLTHRDFRSGFLDLSAIMSPSLPLSYRLLELCSEPDVCDPLSKEGFSHLPAFVVPSSSLACGLLRECCSYSFFVIAQTLSPSPSDQLTSWFQG